MENPTLSLTGTLKKYSIPGITTMFGLQLLRVLLPSFGGYLRDSVGIGSLDLAPIAIGIFALTFLAGVIWRYLGPRNSLWLSAGGVALVRVAEQISVSPALDLYLSAAGSVLFLMYIPIAIAAVRAQGSVGSTQFGLAFLTGVSIDTAIHVSAKTLDLSWQPGLIPIGIVLLFAGVVIVFLGSTTAQLDVTSHREGHWSGTHALFALGPWLLLQVLVFQNVARVASLTGWQMVLAGGLVILGNALGLAAAIWIINRGFSPMITSASAGILLTASLLIPEPKGSTAVAMLLIGQILTFVVAAWLFAGLNSGHNSTGIRRASIANGGGALLFVIVATVYYLSYDISLGIRASVLPPVLAALVTLGAILDTRKLKPETTPGLKFHGATFAAALLIVPILGSFFWIASVETIPSPDNRMVRVMTYNLHNAYNTDGRLDPEAIALVIEESGADVVALQEVSRGWLIWGSMDMLSWLSQRLGMDYVFGPAADAQWGNAIFSKYPIVSAETYRLEPASLLIRRSYIRAEIDIGGGTFTMIDAHFTHVDAHDAEREIQASQLIDAWGAAPATVILGDLNARPDSGAIAIMLGAGLIDVSAAIGEQPTYTYYSADPDHQIDYIFISPDWGYDDFIIPQTTASDHLPLVVTLTLP